MAQPKLKSKMKRADPENYSIHDFLAECKVTDEAESRFSDDYNKQQFEFAQSKGNLEPLFAEVAELLRERGWSKKKDDKGRYHLILGSKYGKSIPFKRFAQLFKWDYGIKPHCNYYRGFENITKLSNLVFTLRKHAQTLRETNNQIEEEESTNLVRRSFVFCPTKPEENEKELENFVAVYESNAKRGVPNMWSVEPVGTEHGAKFKNTLTDDYDKILETAYPEEDNDDAIQGKSAFVVREYNCDPLLLSGDRKFELGLLVLIDHEFIGHVSREIEVLPCDTTFDMSRPQDLDAHWPSQNCSKMPSEQFQKWLSSEHSGSAYDNILARCQAAVSTVLKASKKFLQTVEHGDFTAFQLLRFRFNVDSRFNVSIEGIDAAPELPKDRIEPIAQEVTELAIDPLFSSTASRQSRSRPIFQPLGDAGVPNTSRRNKK